MSNSLLQACRYPGCRYDDDDDCVCVLHKDDHHYGLLSVAGYGHVLELRINSNSSGGGKYPVSGLLCVCHLTPTGALSVVFGGLLVIV